MPVGFGFSVGDFIAVLNLVRTIIDALRTTGGARDSFHELIRQLYALEKALIRVKDVDLDDEQEGDRIALRHAASQCQQTMDVFLSKITKYQPHLGAASSGSAPMAKAKAAFMAIRWAVCKEEDIVKLKADLNAHVISIELLLLAVQMNKASLDARREKHRSSSLVSRMRDIADTFLQKFAMITQQVKELQDMAQQIVRVNFQIFHSVMAIHRVVVRVPPTIQREQPVTLTDPFGRISPFHLDFIRSKECFMAVLRIHFENAGASTIKLDRGEYFVEELSTRCQINLNQEWGACFQPGQHVAMSVVLKHLRHSSWNSCPSCHTECVTGDNEATECPKCGITFRRIVELTDDNPRFRTYRVPAAGVPLAKHATAPDPPFWPTESNIMESQRLTISKVDVFGSALRSQNAKPISQSKRKRAPEEEADILGLKRFRRLGYYPPEGRGSKCELWAIWDPKSSRKTLQGVCTTAIYNVDGNPFLNVREIRSNGWTLVHEDLLDMDCDICTMGSGPDERIILFAGTLKYPKYTKGNPPLAHALCFESDYTCSTIWDVIPKNKKKTLNDLNLQIPDLGRFWLHLFNEDHVQSPIPTMPSPGLSQPWQSAGPEPSPTCPSPLFSVFSSDDGREVKPKTRRNMRAKESLEYARTRRRPACDRCRIRKLRCTHMNDGPTDPSPTLRSTSRFFSSTGSRPEPTGLETSSQEFSFTSIEPIRSSFSEGYAPATLASVIDGPEITQLAETTVSSQPISTASADGLFVDNSGASLDHMWSGSFELAPSQGLAEDAWDSVNQGLGLEPDFYSTASYGLGLWGDLDYSLYEPPETSQGTEGQTFEAADAFFAAATDTNRDTEGK